MPPELLGFVCGMSLPAKAMQSYLLVWIGSAAYGEYLTLYSVILATRWRKNQTSQPRSMA